MKRVLFVLSLAGQLGFMIAIPAALFGFGGAYIDRQLGTSPLFILAGLALAISASSYLVFRFAKEVENAQE